MKKQSSYGVDAMWMRLAELDGLTLPQIKRKLKLTTDIIKRNAQEIGLEFNNGRLYVDPLTLKLSQLDDTRDFTSIEGSDNPIDPVIRVGKHVDIGTEFAINVLWQFEKLAGTQEGTTQKDFTMRLKRDGSSVRGERLG